VCTLSAGDLIFTGTPPGVGLRETASIFAAGHNVEVEIERIGVLRNRVVRKIEGKNE